MKYHTMGDRAQTRPTLCLNSGSIGQVRVQARFSALDVFFTAFSMICRLFDPRPLAITVYITTDPPSLACLFGLPFFLIYDYCGHKASVVKQSATQKCREYGNTLHENGLTFEGP